MSQVYVHFCLYPYTLFLLVITLHIIYFLHLLSTNHKCTQPCYFPLLLKPAAQKENMDWNSSMSSRLCVALVAVPVVLWSLLLFHFAESRLSL
jgi:heme/copper-type cytochrome/quinol oxidase subunit 4